MKIKTVDRKQNVCYNAISPRCYQSPTHTNQPEIGFRSPSVRIAVQPLSCQQHCSRPIGVSTWRSCGEHDQISVKETIPMSNHHPAYEILAESLESQGIDVTAVKKA